MIDENAEMERVPLQRRRNSRSSHYYNELAARRRGAKQTVPTAARITDTLL